MLESLVVLPIIYYFVIIDSNPARLTDIFFHRDNQEK